MSVMPILERNQIVAMNQHYQRFSLDYFLECQQRLGIQNIELWCGSSHFWLDNIGYEDVRMIKKRLNTRGMKVVSLTCPSFGYQYQYAFQEDAGMSKCKAYFENGIRCASELSAKIVTVNSGYGYLDGDEAEMWKRSSELLYSLSCLAEKEGILLALESLREDETNIVNTLESAKRMHQMVGHPSFKLMVDTIASGASGESLESWFDVFGKNLIHMHFLDGDPYVHNIWGDGNTPLAAQLEVLNRYDYKGYLVQEIADEKYFEDPYLADIKNMRMLERFIVN